MFTGEKNYKPVEELREEYGMEDFKLSENEKKTAIELLCEGDYNGLEYLRGIVEDRIPDYPNRESMLDCVRSVISLNGMVVHGEMFGGIHEDFYNQIWELYYDMKMKMLEILGITSKDWDKYEK